MAENDNQPGLASATCRFADAAVRTFGAMQITLRISEPSSGDTQSQLGLEASAAEDLQISPAVIKSLPPTEDGRRRIEVTLGANSLKPIAKAYGVEDISAWLLVAQGIVQQDQLLRVESVTVDQVLGAECLYHLIATE